MCEKSEDEGMLMKRVIALVSVGIVVANIITLNDSITAQASDVDVEQVGIEENISQEMGKGEVEQEEEDVKAQEDTGKAQQEKIAVDTVQLENNVTIPENGTVINSGKCGATEDDNLSWTIYDENNDKKVDTIVISGTGNMADYSESNRAPWGSMLGVGGVDLVIEEGVTHIGNYAFWFGYIQNISFPNSLTSIGNYAFYYTTFLKEIDLQNTKLKSIGRYAFEYCGDLCSVKLPDSLFTISSYAFSDCDELQDIKLPANLEKIEDHVFYSCKNLESIDFPDTIKSLGAYAFYDCLSLSEIKLPEIEKLWINDHVFDGCSNLASLRIDIPVCIGEYAFNACPKLSIKMDYFGFADRRTDLTKNSLKGCKDVEVNVLDGSYVIFDDAFYNCDSLTNITLPSSLEIIGDYAFYNCDSLMNITLPSNLESIGNYAFYYCDNLNQNIEINEYVKIGDCAFEGCKKLTIDGRYGENSKWGKTPFRYCTVNLTIASSKEIIGKRELDYGSEIKTLVIEEGIKEIDYYNFNGISVEEIIFPSSLKSIAGYSFKYCKNLKVIAFKNPDIFISSMFLFEGCSNYVIYSYKNSTAEEWAVSQNKPFDLYCKLSGHEWNSEYTIDKQATCEESGVKSIHCNVCDIVKEKSAVEIEVIGHKFNKWEIIKQPTINEAGEQKRICSVCGKEEIEYIDKLPYGEWKKDGKGWWYSVWDGTYPKNCWKKIDRKWYRLDFLGYRVSGWNKISNAWYYFDLKEGFMYENRWEKIDGNMYYFDGNGKMATGWIYLDDNWYYLNVNGVRLVGWIKIGNTWYYMDPVTGRMAKNTWISNKYYVDSNGKMVTGWLNQFGVWHYFNGSGTMVTGWLKLGRIWYYMDPENGEMAENKWISNTYYMKKSGAMSIGWVELGEDYYYFNSSGQKVTNKWIGNYYLKTDGVMAKNEIVDGKYYVDEKGKWKP